MACGCCVPGMFRMGSGFQPPAPAPALVFSTQQMHHCPQGLRPEPHCWPLLAHCPHRDSHPCLFLPWYLSISSHQHHPRETAITIPWRPQYSLCLYLPSNQHFGCPSSWLWHRVPSRTSHNPDASQPQDLGTCCSLRLERPLLPFLHRWLLLIFQASS